MRIKQCKMMDRSQKNIFENFFKKYSLGGYVDTRKPSVFFSLWKYGRLVVHQSFALIIWRGTDIIRIEKKLKRIKERKNTYHIAISSYIAKDLDKYGIKYKFIPVVGANMKYFKPCPIGDEIYTYVPSHNISKYHERYGMEFIKKIKKRCKYKINIVKPNQYTKRELFKVYSRCFCGLRLTKHDGLPNQVIEMGLMGRKSFYNGDIPGSIKWDGNDIDKIIENINEEAKKIGTTDYTYANKIKDFIDVGEKWLDTKFWDKKFNG